MGSTAYDDNRCVYFRGIADSIAGVTEMFELKTILKTRRLSASWFAVFFFLPGIPGVPVLGAQAPSVVTIKPGTLPVVTTVDERYQSYNIEMLEVTGGRFWKPYAALAAQTADTGAASTPAGMNPDMYAYRAPKDLGNARLRALATALGPAYVRVSGTWANSTYLPAADETVTTPPEGFGGVLTRAQWKGVIDFAGATNAEIVTSFATSVGTRDAHGEWTPVQAKRFMEYTRALHGHIVAAEFMNEPTFAALGGAPKGYDAAQYGRDFHRFLEFAHADAPGMKIAGPGSVGESTGPSLGAGFPGFIPTPKLLEAAGSNNVDIFSYHAYGGASQRCSVMGTQQSTPEGALTEAWLAKSGEMLAFYKEQRDRFDPGKPLWLTETGETGCGGNPWASTFLDSFRYLDQLGRLAKGGVKVVMHNTLAASDYGLLDENTFEPRPNYWAALLWRRLMGTTVLDAGVPTQEGLHVYAHCLRGKSGGVALLVIQNDPAAAHTLRLTAASERYTLSAATLQSRQVLLNGEPLALGSHDELPGLKPMVARAGVVSFAPGSITFLAVPAAGDASCK